MPLAIMMSDDEAMDFESEAAFSCGNAAPDDEDTNLKRLETERNSDDDSGKEGSAKPQTKSPGKKSTTPKGKGSRGRKAKGTIAGSVKMRQCPGCFKDF